MYKRWLGRAAALSLTVLLFACQPKDRRALVVGKIKEASELATTEFTIDKVVFGTKEKRLLRIIKLNEARFVAYSQAVVKTGIDLSKLKEEDITIRENMISIDLPHIEVVNFSYPAESFRFDREISDNAFLNEITIEDQEHLFREAELDIRESLQFMGMVETTERKTRALMEKLLRMLGYTEIYISFKKGDLITPVNLEGIE